MFRAVSEVDVYTRELFNHTVRRQICCDCKQSSVVCTGKRPASLSFLLTDNYDCLISIVMSIRGHVYIMLGQLTLQNDEYQSLFS